ncbi:alpha/beta fold hydrolase [Rhodovibrionaceae bacterium A322]
MGDSPLGTIKEFGELKRPGGITLRWLKATPSAAGSSDPASKICVLLHGRTEFIEKYDEVIDELTDRGYGVWTFDWRGQGLSSRETDNPHKGHSNGFQDYLDDLQAFLDQVVDWQGAEHCLLMAHSMGGHLALRHLLGGQSRFTAAAISAPMTAIRFGGTGRSRLVKWIARFGSWLGKARDYAPGSGDCTPQSYENSFPKLTSNRARYESYLAAVRSNPDLELGGVTFGWLNQAIKSSKILMREAASSRHHPPITLFLGGREQIVDNNATLALSALVSGSEVIIYPEAQHEILMESDAIWSQFWVDFDERFGA